MKTDGSMTKYEKIMVGLHLAKIIIGAIGVTFAVYFQFIR